MMKSRSVLETVFLEFLELAKIPRPSHHEEAISSYLFHWASNRHLAVQKDRLGNVIIDKEASPGCENAPRVILQAHMDMVCVAAPGVAYEPLTDPVKVVRDGAKMFAEGTSLGADDGIGIAICLYLLQATTGKHGPLRVIFTVNEEDGMSSGAMDSRFFDARYLINLDWERFGSLCNSSAGSDFSLLTRDVKRRKADESAEPMQLHLSGLLGGHSGIDINCGRQNAIVGMASILRELSEAGVSYEIADVYGGQARNAIPSSAVAALWVPKEALLTAEKVVADCRESLVRDFRGIEPNCILELKRNPAIGRDVLDPDAVADLLALLAILPNNVHTMSPFVPGLVESSQNIGLLSIENDAIHVSVMQRSCSQAKGAELQKISKAVAVRCGFSYQAGEHNPVWEVRPGSKLTALACDEYFKLTGQEMIVEPVHAGLECGAFSEMNPQLELIAIGPTLCDVHTPKESCDLESVGMTAILVENILEKLADL